MANRIHPTEQEIEQQIQNFFARTEKIVRMYEEIEQDLAVLTEIQMHRPLTDKELDQENDLLVTLGEMDAEG